MVESLISGVADLVLIHMDSHSGRPLDPELSSADPDPHVKKLAPKAMIGEVLFRIFSLKFRYFQENLNIKMTVISIFFGKISLHWAIFFIFFIYMKYRSW